MAAHANRAIVRDVQDHKQQHLSELLRALLAKSADSSEVRDDIAPGELVSYCLHALAGARSLPSRAAVLRLVKVTLAGLHPRT